MLSPLAKNVKTYTNAKIHFYSCCCYVYIKFALETLSNYTLIHNYTLLHNHANSATIRKQLLFCAQTIRLIKSTMTA